MGAILVKDQQAQRRSYADVLGLPLTGDYGDALFFDCGDQKLALFARSHHPEGTSGWKGRARASAIWSSGSPPATRTGFAGA